jgi:hypothetical protein
LPYFDGVTVEPRASNVWTGVVTLKQLDPERILQTSVLLELRIKERFPESGLSTVCGQLVALAKESQDHL